MAQENNPSIVISKDTFRRLVKDAKEIIVNPLISHGIYYLHNEDDILKGNALIIGPSETPYENGYYLFTFKFPSNYPHSPPEVKFCTSDGQTRFNPNLYTHGKVCVSILNTWKGEKWTGCQTISSVLLALCTLLTNTPLLNEPGVTEKHTDYTVYNTIITYKNFETAILKVITNDYVLSNFSIFSDVMKTHFLDTFSKNIERLDQLCKNYPMKIKLHTTIYNMNITVDYPGLLDKFHNVKNSISNT
jgi:ubiquitin-protein ligase